MAAPTTVSDQAIIAAGKQLLAAKGKVTGWRLHKIVKAGNPGRLMTVWQEHVASETSPISPPLPLPPAVQDEVTAMQTDLASFLEDAFRSVWEAAERAAHDRLQGEVAEARSAATAAEEDLTLAAETLMASEAARLAAVADADARSRELTEALAAQHAWRGRAEMAEENLKAALQASEAAAVERGQLMQRLEAAARIGLPEGEVREAADGRNGLR